MAVGGISLLDKARALPLRSFTLISSGEPYLLSIRPPRKPRKWRRRRQSAAIELILGRRVFVYSRGVERSPLHHLLPLRPSSTSESAHPDQSWNCRASVATPMSRSRRLPRTPERHDHGGRAVRDSRLIPRTPRRRRRMRLGSARFEEGNCAAEFLHRRVIANQPRGQMRSWPRR